MGVMYLFQEFNEAWRTLQAVSLEINHELPDGWRLIVVRSAQWQEIFSVIARSSRLKVRADFSLEYIKGLLDSGHAKGAVDEAERMIRTVTDKIPKPEVPR